MNYYHKPHCASLDKHMNKDCNCGEYEGIIEEIIVDHDKNYIKPMEPHPPISKAQDDAYTLNNLEMLELLYFMYTTGYISRENHQPIEDLKFEFESRLDNLEPGWSPIDIPNLVKKYRKEYEDANL